VLRHRRRLRLSLVPSLAAACLLAAVLVGAAPAPGSAAVPARRPADDPTVAKSPILPVGHVGRWLTDASGRVLLLHGVNLVAKVPRETPAEMGFGDDDAAWLVANGFDVVRLGTTAASIMPSPGVIDRAYLASFAATVKMLAAHGLLVLVDLHQDGWGPTLGDDGFPDWMTVTHGATDTHTTFPGYYVTNPAIQAAFQSLWDDDADANGVALQDDAAQVWSAYAGAVAKDRHVLGYDLLNEPWPGTTWAPCVSSAGCPAQDVALSAYEARMVAAIRGAGASGLVFGEPYVLFNFGAPTTIALPGGDAASGLSWHMYTVDPAAEPSVIQFADDWSTQTGGALLNTEFGATTDPAAIDRMVGELDDGLQPWIWWSYDEFDHDLHQPPSDAVFDVPAVDELVRPHPVVVAGTPTSEHYDPAARTLSFTYATSKVGGGSFACGSLTTIQVPRRSYPGGYHVTVSGGVVVSTRGSGALEVVADRGAASVTIAVAPGAWSGRSTAAAACA
jgi:endoglycosylceramidase